MKLSYSSWFSRQKQLTSDRYINIKYNKQNSIHLFMAFIYCLLVLHFSTQSSTRSTHVCNRKIFRINQHDLFDLQQAETKHKAQIIFTTHFRQQEAHSWCKDCTPVTANHSQVLACFSVIGQSWEVKSLFTANLKHLLWPVVCQPKFAYSFVCAGVCLPHIHSFNTSKIRVLSIFPHSVV